MDSGGIRRDECAGSERNRRRAGGLIVASRGAGTVAALRGSMGKKNVWSACSFATCFFGVSGEQKCER
jgi:hypothetical protein